MSLYKRTVLIIISTLLGLVVILYAASLWITLGSFRDFEHDQTEQQVRLVLDALDQAREQIRHTAYDWATWDDTYDFVSEPNQGYITNNLNRPALANLGLDFLLFVNVNGQVVFARSMDQTGQTLDQKPIPTVIGPELLQRLLTITEADDRGQVGGYLSLPKGLALVVTSPVRHSDGSGPSAGAMVMGRYLNNNQVSRLATLIGGKVDLLACSPETKLEHPILASPHLDQQGIVVRPLSDETVAGAALVDDLFGKPVIGVLVSTPRAVFNEGRASLWYYILSLLLAGCVFGLVFLVLLDKYVLSRLKRLMASVERIGTTRDSTARVEVGGADELARLATGINSMLSELDTAHRAIREAHNELEQRVAERTRDLEAAQEHVIEQERMRALGQMASGIAHDFNNALATILGSVELMMMERAQRKFSNDEDQLIQSIHLAAQDAANAVSRLREFYRFRDEAEALQNVDLTMLVDQVVGMTEPMWKDQALAKGLTLTIARKFQPVPLVPANEAELREMLTNLIFNAIDAMPKGGTITVGTEQVGDIAYLSVGDTGTGMTEEVRQHCLEPFFTTKGKKGTGLGLAMVHGTVRRHHGMLDIESEPGQGTTIRVGIPIHASQPILEADDQAIPEIAPMKILLVDDVPSVRSIVRAYLTADSHVVHEAKNGREGLGRFFSETYDLVITDRGMPDMSGDQLAAEILQSSPHTPVIMLTGFGEMMRSAGEQPEGVDLVVSKPVTLAKLRRAIFDVLAQRRARQANAAQGAGGR